MHSKLLLLQLNEINFDIVYNYLLKSNKNKFKNLKNLKNTFFSFETYSENEYENLEPWIQWTSVYLGKNFKEHKIFRLGDIINFPKEKQIFELIESKGFKVGTISPMNADNRLKNPCYFIPDPWTNTHSDTSSYSKKLTFMLRQTVNDNSSGKLSLKSIFTIIEVVLKTLNYNRTYYLINLIISSIFNPWKKSLILDYLIHLIHLDLLKKKKPSFSSIFFNAGAHIQHHYLYNCKYIKKNFNNPEWYVKSTSDPFEDMLEVYDKIIGDYIKLSKDKFDLIISTGLRQVPYETRKFYYRLKNHSYFLKEIGLNFLKVHPRMTRDFEITFNNNIDRDSAKNTLRQIRSKKDNIHLFNEIEERDKSLFVTLTYPNEVKKDNFIVLKNGLELNFFDQVVFVALKNGMHDSKGYVFCSSKSNFEIPKKKVHVSKIHEMIVNYFKFTKNYSE